jgi:hypothetical protein
MQVYSASYFQGVISSAEGQALGVGHLHPGPEGRTLRSRAEMLPPWALPLGLVHREIIKKVIYFHTHAGFWNLPCIVGSAACTGPLHCLGFSHIKNTLPEVIACITYPPNTLRNFSKCSAN